MSDTTTAPVRRPLGRDYLAAVSELVASRQPAVGERITAAAELVGRSVAEGGILHLFGSGHSRLVAIDAAARAATLTASRAVVAEEWPGQVERVEGLGEIILRRTDLGAGEVIVVISNSGLNPLPIDVAMVASARGASVVGVGSAAHSLAGESRHSSGRRLLDVSDVFLDTGVPAGDALFEPDDTPPAGPASTILAATLVHAVIVEASRWMRDHGSEPPVRRSRNLPGGDEHNAALAARYQDRIPELRWI
ncbi:MAG TPA: sugar isomerase domain-containing protein [Jiangellaceae bacterium]